MQLKEISLKKTNKQTSSSFEIRPQSKESDSVITNTLYSRHDQY